MEYEKPERILLRIAIKKFDIIELFYLFLDGSLPDGCEPLITDKKSLLDIRDIIKEAIDEHDPESVHQIYRSKI